MGPAANLRLYHEVTVADASQQEFTDLACFPFTTEAGLSERYPFATFAGSLTP